MNSTKTLSFSEFYNSLKSAEKYQERMKFQSDITALTGMSINAFYNRIAGRTSFSQSEKIAIQMYFNNELGKDVSIGELFPEE